MKIKREYNAGYEIGLKALQQCANKYDSVFIRANCDDDTIQNIAAGLLSAIIAGIYHVSPDDDAALSLVMFAIDQAKGVE